MRMILVAGMLALGGCTSALVKAAKEGESDKVRALLPGDKKHCGAALREAAAARKDDILAVILDGGCDINAADRDGYTPLMYSAMRGDNEAVKLLLLRNADPDRLTWNDKSAAKLAREHGHKDTAALLEQGAVAAMADASSDAAAKVRRQIYELFRATKRGEMKNEALAAAALIKMGAVAVPDLIRAARGEGVVDDADPALKGMDTRRMAIKVLGLIGPAAGNALPMLTECLEDPDLHDAASEALLRIRRKPGAKPQR